MTFSRLVVALTTLLVITAIPAGTVQGATSTEATGSAITSSAAAPQSAATPTLAVTVVNESDSPLRNARVTVNQSGATVDTGFTDRLGRFNANVSNGSYTVQAEAGGYLSNTTNGTVSGETRTTVELTPAGASTTTWLDFEVQVTGRHTGCAVGGTYSIQNVGSGTYSENGTLGPDGHIETELPVPVDASGTIVPTDYRLTVDRPNYDRFQQTSSIDGETRADVRLDPTKGSIQVEVRAQHVQSMLLARNATVSVTGECPNSEAMARSTRHYRTNDSGTVTVEKLPPADYTIEVSKWGYETATLSQYLDPGQHATRRANLSLLDPSNISVDVTEHLNFTETKDRAQPLANASVTFHDHDTGRNWTRDTDPNGTARLENLPPGRYVTTINKSRTTRHGATVAWGQDRNATYLPIGDTQNLTATLQRNQSRIDTTALVDGHFVWTNRSRIMNFTGIAADYPVRLRHVDTGTVVTAHTDTDGVVAETLPAGAYEIWTDEEVTWPPAAPAELDTLVREPGEREDGGDAGTPPRLLLDDDQDWTAEPGLVFVPKLGSLTLKVSYPVSDPVYGTFPQPVENATVTLTDPGGETYEAKTNPHGKVAFPRVEPGDVSVTMEKEGYIPKTSTVSVASWASNRSTSDVLDGEFNDTSADREVSVDGGGSFSFGIAELDLSTGNYSEDGGLVLISHVDDDREERYHTYVENGDTVGPFPQGTYRVYLQAAVTDERVDKCEKEYIIPTRETSPGHLEFKYGGGTISGVTEFPLELEMRDNVTSEPIRTENRSEVFMEFGYHADPCDGSKSLTNRTFRTGTDGEALGEVLSPPRFTGGYDLSELRLKSPGNFEKPYAAFPAPFSFPLGLEYVFHMDPNSATVLGQTNSTRGRLLENVSVRLGRLSDTTNASGQYEVAGVPNGTYEMRFAKRGYYSNLTDVSVTVQPGQTATTVTKPADQPVTLEPLPEPIVNVEQPMQGVFLEGVPFDFQWNITIRHWALNQSRPGGDDQIEGITYFALIDGEPVKLDSQSLDLEPGDLPKDVSMSVDPAELTTGIDSGEFRDIEEFFVVLETRKLGEIRYPPINQTQAGNASIIAMPPWLEVTHDITRAPKEELVSQLAGSSDVAERVFKRVIQSNRHAIQLDFTDDVWPEGSTPAVLNKFSATPRITVIGGMRFRPYRPEHARDSANYEFGYQVNVGGQSYPIGNKLLEKTGLTSIGMPMVKLDGRVNGTAYGEIQQQGRAVPLPEYESNASVSVAGGAFTSADERVIPFAPGVTGGVGLEYSERGSANLPVGDTSYKAYLDGEGNLTVSLKSLSYMFGQVQAAAIPVDIGADASFTVDSEVSGTSRSLAASKQPLVLAGGDQQTWTNTGNLTVGLGVTGEVGWGAWLSEGLRLSLEGNLTDMKFGTPVFSAFKGGFSLDATVKVLTVGGKIDVGEWNPIHIRFDDGSPSTGVFTTVNRTNFRIDRYWTQVAGYDSQRSWASEGVLTERAHPHANPSVAVDDGGQIHLVAGHDRGTLSPATGLTLRYFRGDATGVSQSGTAFSATNATFTPAIASQNGSQRVAFAGFTQHRDFGADDIQTSEIYYAASGDGGRSWSQPIQVTDNLATESSVRVAPCGPNRTLLAWTADRTGLLSQDDVELRYALVNDSAVVNGPVVLEDGGVRGPAGLACHGGTATIAYPIDRSGTGGTRTNATVVARYLDVTGQSAVPSVMETLTTGSEVVAVDRKGETALVGIADRSRGELTYHLLDAGTAVQNGTVSTAEPASLDVADGPGTETILTWTRGSGAAGVQSIQYARWNGTHWSNPTTAVHDADENRTWLSAAGDPATGTLYLASLAAPTATPIADERTTNLTVEAVDLANPPAPVVTGTTAAGDGDDDGLFEDVDGENGFTVQDVLALYDNLRSSPVQNNPERFNFNGDPNDVVDVLDVIALFAQLK